LASLVPQEQAQLRPIHRQIGLPPGVAPNQSGQAPRSSDQPPEPV